MTDDRDRRSANAIFFRAEIPPARRTLRLCRRM
jgi:hypothetical protein